MRAWSLMAEKEGLIRSPLPPANSPKGTLRLSASRQNSALRRVCRTKGFTPPSPKNAKGPLRDPSRFWRRRRDSNPRYAINVYSLSRGAPSATRPLLQILFISSRSDLPFALPGRALLGASHLALRVAALPPALLRSLGPLGQPLGHFS